MLLVDILETFTFQVCLQLGRSGLNFTLYTLLWRKEDHICRLVDFGQKVLQLALVLEHGFLGATYVPSNSQDLKILVAWIDRYDSGSILVLFLTLDGRPPLSIRDGPEVRVIVRDAEESRELENLMDRLEYNCDIIEAIFKFVLDFHLDCAIVTSRDIELMQLFIIKCVNSNFLAISNIENLESDVLIDKLTIFVSFGFSMQVDVVSRIIIFKHHAFKANIRVATLLLSSNHLRSDPVYTSLIMVTL